MLPPLRKSIIFKYKAYRPKMLRRRHDITAQDNAAIVQARTIVDEHDVELWQLDRKVVLLRRRK